MNKPNIKFNEVTKKWEVYNPAIEEADCYIALTNHKEFIVVEMAAQAEKFLTDSGVGGSIYAINHHEHKDEVLPQSTFIKEVP